MTRINKRLRAMHSMYGVTEGKRCRSCYHWHEGAMLCLLAPKGKQYFWGATWPACGEWGKRG